MECESAEWDCDITSVQILTRATSFRAPSRNVSRERNQQIKVKGRLKIRCCWGWDLKNEKGAFSQVCSCLLGFPKLGLSRSRYPRPTLRAVGFPFRSLFSSYNCLASNKRKKTSQTDHECTVYGCDVK